MKHKAIVYQKKDSIYYIVLNRPECGNTIDSRMCDELLDVCKEIGQDDSINVVVIKGAGGIFCSGAEPSAVSCACAAIDAVSRIECAVIAAIEGEAIGEGLELALVCDIRLATDNAEFGLPQVSNAAIPSGGGTQRLPRLVGLGRAAEMILTAEIIDAAEAFRIGLVNKVIPSQDLANEVDLLAGMIAKQGPIALRFAKEAVINGMDLTLEQGLRLEADMYFLIQTSEDRMEGIRSFLEKRPPDFKGI